VNSNECLAILDTLDEYKHDIKSICCLMTLVSNKPIPHIDKLMIQLYATSYCFKAAENGLDIEEQLSVLNSPITNNVLPFIVSKQFILFNYKLSLN